MWSEGTPVTNERLENMLKESLAPQTEKWACMAERFQNSPESAWEIVGQLPTEREIFDLSGRVRDVAVAPLKGLAPKEPNVQYHIFRRGLIALLTSLL